MASEEFPPQVRSNDRQLFRCRFREGLPTIRPESLEFCGLDLHAPKNNSAERLKQN